MADSDEKTEAPSSKRRSEAREKGDVARSTEINSVMVLVAGLVLIRVSAGWMYERMMSNFTNILAMMVNPHLGMADLMRLLRETIMLTGTILLPVCIGIMVAGVSANLLQVGILFTLKPLEPKLDKINPLAGFKRLFSMKSLVELAKNLMKIGVVGLVVYLTLHSEFKTALQMGSASVGAIMLYMLNVSFTIFLRVALVLLVIAILDYAYQRFEHEKKLKMSKQEVKDERKQMEGDPKVKARIRSLHLEMARRRMMKDVPKATVVVTNPTHIAIALQYDPPAMQAPRVVAKGKRLVAQRIKEIAKAHNVPCIEDKPLARAMYDKVTIGEDIPMEFFTAVAEILAYIYKIKNRKAA